MVGATGIWVAVNDKTVARLRNKKYKPMKPIDEEKPNNEEIAALINMGRMGFEHMQPASQEFSPDGIHARNSKTKWSAYGGNVITMQSADPGESFVGQVPHG